MGPTTRSGRGCTSLNKKKKETRSQSNNFDDAESTDTSPAKGGEAGECLDSPFSKNCLSEEVSHEDRTISSLLKNSQDIEPTVVSSGRNTIDIIGMMKRQRSASKELERKAEAENSALTKGDSSPKHFSSGRNTINVMEMMRNRKSSTELIPKNKTPSPVMSSDTSSHSIVESSSAEELEKGTCNLELEGVDKGIKNLEFTDSARLIKKINEIDQIHEINSEFEKDDKALNNECESVICKDKNETSMLEVTDKSEKSENLEKIDEKKISEDTPSSQKDTVPTKIKLKMFKKKDCSQEFTKLQKSTDKSKNESNNEMSIKTDSTQHDISDTPEKTGSPEPQCDDKNETLIGPTAPPKEFFSMQTKMKSAENTVLDDDIESVQQSKISTSPKREMITQAKKMKSPVVPIEYISEYSNESKKKRNSSNFQSKKGSEDQKDVSVDEQQHVPIPLILKQIDTSHLEKETEQYYMEVGSSGTSTNIPVSQTNGQKTIKEKPKCLTPKEIARIAKNYPSSSSGQNEASAETQASWTTLHQYWTHVQENPYDFDGWTYLMNHVETMDNIEAARSAFEGFLPLYPYCFAYWKKLSDLELKFADSEQCLGVLYNGTRSVPFCPDLWIPLLNQFMEYAKQETMSDESIRGVFEFAIENTGLVWQSSCIWQLYIDYEQSKEDLVRVFDIYRRLISVPTKLFNKHWDLVLALIRDHHPRNYLSVNEYFKLKKHVSELKNVQFVPPPMVPPNHLLKVAQKDDPLQTMMMEKIVASLIPDHEANELECDMRWKFEDKIKRPYFHVKPLERKQLKNWREYLDFEIRRGDPVRTVTLFERCLIPCAMYEEFWCKYAAFFEGHVQNVTNGKYSNMDYKPANFFCPKTDNDINKESPFDFWESPITKPAGTSKEIKFEVRFLLDRFGQSIGLSGKVLCSPSLTPSSILQSVTWDDVRQIYRRAAWIHCPSKPKLLMQWAEFEESQGNAQSARELLNDVIAKNPMFLSARIQLIELERRSENYDRVEELYAQTFSTFKDSKIKSCVAIKYARFLFKIKEEVEKSLMILRKAMKKDKGNIHLYHHVFDICYQRRPVDVHGVLAAVMLALAAKEMSLEEKNWFCIKRLYFLQEHGTISQYKNAKIEAVEIRLKYDAELEAKAEAEKKLEEATKKIEAEKEAEKKSSLTENKAAEEEEEEVAAPEAREENEKRKRSESPKRKSKKKEKREKGEIREHRSSKRSKKSPEKQRGSSAKRKHTEDVEMEDDKNFATDEPLQFDPQVANQGYSSYPAQLAPNVNPQNITSATQPHHHQRPPVAPSNDLSNFNTRPNDGEYHTVSPSWEQNQVVSANYGYANSHPIVKEHQNDLYNRYYDMISQRYNNSQEKANQQQQQSVVPPHAQYSANSLQEAMAVNAAAASVAGIAGRDPNSYLPPPPVPQGILGDSLFNQSSVIPPFTQMELLNTNSNTFQPRIQNLDQSRKLPSPFKTINQPEEVDNLRSLSNEHFEQPGDLNDNQSERNENISIRNMEDTETTTAVASGRNPIDVKSLMKHSENQDVSNIQEDSSPTKIFASGRNTINVMSLMRNRKNSTELAMKNQNVPPLLSIDTSSCKNKNNMNKPSLLGLPPNVRSLLPKFRGCNVPEWLIRDGGELKLSSSPNGESILRFWPRYMNEQGQKTLFHSLRNSIKWVNRRHMCPTFNKLVAMPKQVSWVGPCDYEKDGLMLPANTNWPPEIVDLLHRLIHLTNCSFNSSFLSLYSSGYAHHPWNTEMHQALQKNPTIATVSLGNARMFEMKRTNGSNYLRFQLPSGSLLILEGAVQEDWLCQIPKETEVNGERISVSFRTMLMIKGLTV